MSLVLERPCKEYPFRMIQRATEDFDESNMGLSTIMQANQHEAVTTFVQGTRGYIDPHYRKSHKCSTKTDVYAFGVVLLELLTGTHVTGSWTIPDPDVTDLASWIQQKISDGTFNQIIDPNIVHEVAPNCRNSFAKIVSKSLQNDPGKRPIMSAVVAQLEDAFAMRTGTNPSSSIIDGDLHGYFNGFTDTNSDYPSKD
ncbi:putative receptor-like protein kinase At2g23200 [Bidens hawaiensis]|uniref:putative receptor-like protein kinase At2g23200 n=1 Tax=Bidens hawaiensis TaxID=980011 RepID=UPI00404B11AC